MIPHAGVSTDSLSVEVVSYERKEDNIPAPARVTWAQLEELLAEHKEVSCKPWTPRRCTHVFEPGVVCALETLHQGAHAPTGPWVAHCPGKECLAKNTSAWSPVTFLPPERAPSKDAAGNVLRKAVNVATVNAAVFDLDHLDTYTGGADQALALFRRSGLRWVAHSTHSHREGNASLRVAVPLSRPVPSRDWPRFLAAVVVGLGIPADPSCKDVSRIYFDPTKSRGAAALSERSPGGALDVDAWLARTPAPADQQPEQQTIADVPAVDLTPPPTVKQLFDLVIDLRDRKATAGQDRDLLNKVLQGRALAGPGGRDDAMNQIAFTLALKFPEGTPAEGFVEVMRRSIADMAVPEGVQHWAAVAAEKFTRHMAGRIDRDRRRELAAEGMAQALTRMTRAAGAAAGAAPAGAIEPVPAPAWAPIDDSFFLWSPGSAKGVPQIKQVTHNAVQALTHDPVWAGAFRFNVITKNIEVHGGALPDTDRHLSVLHLAVGNWLQSHYKIDLGEQAVKGSILLVARRSPYDPLLEWLLSLRWDGVPRCDQFLARWCRAVSDQGSDHLARVSSKWLISMAARAVRPGVQVDTVLVLEGPEGLKKSSLFEVMGGEWFSNNSVNLADKDTKMLVSQTWLVELAELASLRKSAQDQADSFITTRRDNFRPPYASAIEAFERRAVIAATYNPVEGRGWLEKRSDNRRWWPVQITARIDMAAVRSVRDQVWAEAVVRAQRALAAKDAGVEPDACDRWWLDGPEEEHLARQAAAARLDPAASAEFVARWWFDQKPEQRPRRVQVVDVALAALRTSQDRVTKAITTDVSNALRDLGFRCEVGTGGTRGSVWVPSQALLDAPQEIRTSTPGVTFALVSGSKPPAQQQDGS